MLLQPIPHVQLDPILPERPPISPEGILTRYLDPAHCLEREFCFIPLPAAVFNALFGDVAAELDAQVVAGAVGAEVLA